MTVTDLFRALRRHFVAILAVTLIGLLAGVAVSKLSPSSTRYSATAIAYLQITSAQDWDPDNQYNHATGSQIAGMKNNSYQTLYKSEENISEALERLGMDDEPTDIFERISTVRDNEKLTTEVTVEHDNAEDAQDLANTLVEVVAEDVADFEGPNSPFSIHLLNPATAIGVTSGGPSLTKMTLAGIVGGLFLGVLLSLALWASERRIMTASDLAKTLDVPILATFCAPTKVDDAEGTRRLRTAVAGQGEPPVVIVSPRESTTATDVAIALARSAASAHVPTVLVDVSGEATAAFPRGETESARGLADVLRGEARLEDVSVEVSTHLRFLSAGTGSSSLKDLVASRIFAETIANLASSSFVVITAPGILTSATVPSMGHIEGIRAVMLAEAGDTTFSDVVTAAEKLDRAGISVSGTVITQLDNSTFARLRFGDPTEPFSMTLADIERHAL